MDTDTERIDAWSSFVEVQCRRVFTLSSPVEGKGSMAQNRRF